MGLEATWKTTCDECGKVRIRRMVLNKRTVRDSHFDIWGPGVRDGMIQIGREKEGYPLIFCNKTCCHRYIRRTKGEEAAREFETGVWVA